ncbi:MAG: nicotinamide-nucleotide amidohydrolase family protein [Actinobacteria bacterium]|nr:nicotinamide-nucleotide amidohydrolase family protein [Actinomycetota bacterium]MCL5071970.1 nicotinamide-nucleotide amidohydrolase family protein [Actinomycetota bacterium]
MKFSIVSIGTELSLGLILNTNSKYIAEMLTELGLECNYMITVRDDFEDIGNALKEAVNHSGIIIISGGLGPTDDDLTRAAVAMVLNKTLVKNESLDETSLRFLKWLKNKNIEETLKRQSFIPEDSIPIKPRIGSASGFIIKLGSDYSKKAEGKSKWIFSIPGVPKEMKDMLDNDVIPFLKSLINEPSYAEDKIGPEFLRKKILLTTDISESEMEFKIKDAKLLAKDLNVEIGVTANPGLIKIMLLARSNDEKKCDSNLKIIEKKIREAIADNIYGKDNDNIADSIREAINKKDRKITISAAESVTGGLISSILTDTPGSSEFFIGSIVSYSISAKEKILNISDDVITKKGVVSPDVCLEMAQNAKRIFHSDFAVGTTGVAGPKSPEKNKKIGLVYCCLIGPNSLSEVYEKNFIGTRTEIKFRVAQFILNKLRLAINNL